MQPQFFFHSPSFSKDSPHLYCLFLLSLLSLLVLFYQLSQPYPSSPSPSASLYVFPSSLSLAAVPPSPPSLAYLVSGRTGDADRILRLLLAIYHPSNVYLLYLDRSATDAERSRLALATRSAVPDAGRNVHVVGAPDFANPRGPSSLATTLHAAALLLRLDPLWAWFINLDASDYPLMPQDDILHVFSYLPRDLNFVQHNSYIGWKELRRLKPIIIAPELYLSSRTDAFYATQQHEMPNAYKIFTGSSAVIISRKFVKHCILGTENLARNLLMYCSNLRSPQMNYFQTILCNSPDFNKTVVNHNLRYVTWEMLPETEPRLLTTEDLGNLSKGSAIFASKFSKDDDSLLDIIDEKLLKRAQGKIVPGGWCLDGGWHGDPCAVLGNPNVLKPSSGAEKLANFIADLLLDQNLHSQQCIYV